MTETSVVSTSIAKLSKKDMMAMFAKELPTIAEARYMVDMYYQMQHYRIASGAQIRSATVDEDPCCMLEFFKGEFEGIENQIKRALDAYTTSDRVANTVKQITGIGPVISAGLISNLNITRAHTAGAYWRFCGIDPTLDGPKKGEKLHYSKKMKTLVTFKLGESFVKVQNNENDFYGHFYKEWKEEYIRRNETGLLKENAEEVLRSKNFGKDTDAYKSYIQGKLPPAHIHAMARRKPLMYFISHLFDLQYQLHNHKKSPIPYIIAIGGHTHMIENPLIPIYENMYGKIELE